MKHKRRYFEIISVCIFVSTMKINLSWWCFGCNVISLYEQKPLKLSLNYLNFCPDSRVQTPTRFGNKSQITFTMDLKGKLKSNSKIKLLFKFVSMLKAVVLLTVFVVPTIYIYIYICVCVCVCFFRILWTKSPKEKHLSETEIFCNTVNVFVK